MSHNNNNYQEIPLSTKDLLRTQQKDLVCSDCGGISAVKVQQLLSTLEGTTQLFNTTTNNIIPNNQRKKISRIKSIKNKKMNSARNNSQKTTLKRKIKKNKTISKRIQHSTKQKKLNMNKIRSKSKNNNNNHHHTIKIKKLSSKIK